MIVGWTPQLAIFHDGLRQFIAMEVVMNKRLSTEYDPWIYGIVVLVLGLAVLASLVGTIILATDGHATPELLVALGSAAVGGLAGLLAPSPLNR